MTRAQLERIGMAALMLAALGLLAFAIVGCGGPDPNRPHSTVLPAAFIRPTPQPEPKPMPSASSTTTVTVPAAPTALRIEPERRNIIWGTRRPMMLSIIDSTGTVSPLLDVLVNTITVYCLEPVHDAAGAVLGYVSCGPLAKALITIWGRDYPTLEGGSARVLVPADHRGFAGTLTVRKAGYAARTIAIPPGEEKPDASYAIYLARE